jgi:cytochrome c556
MRFLILFVLGFLIGGALALLASNAMHERDAYPHGVMAVMKAQMAGLDGSVRANRCTANDLVPRLQTLRAVANDIEPAFAEDAEPFVKYAGDLRAAVDEALATPPANCKAAAATVARVGDTCTACHRDYRD